MTPPEVHPHRTRRITRGVLLTAGLVAYARLFIGVDVTDESFYSALPYSFALGFRPYHDELNITQNAGILLTPFFKLYCSAVPSLSGLVLFNRHLYFLAVCVCSYLTYRVVATQLDRDFGRILAAFTLTYSYFNIPSLSYNTLGSLFLFAGLQLLLLFSAAGGRPRGHWLVAGANGCFAVSAFAHPALLGSSILGLGISFWLCRRHAQRPARDQQTACLRAWFASTALAACAAVFFLVSVGPAAIRDALAYAGSYGYDLGASLPRTLRRLAWQISVLAPYLAAFAAILALPILSRRSFSAMRTAFPCGVAILTAAMLYLIHRQPSYARFPAGSVPLIISFAVLLPGALYLLPDRSKARDWAVIVGLPCLAGAASVAFSSTNGLTSATLALYPAAMCCLLAVAMIADEIDRDPASNRARRPAMLATSIFVVAFTSVALVERSYRDAPFTSGDRPVFAPGPFAGLITSKSKALRLAALHTDLNSLGSRARSLFVYDRFPAAHLLSPLKPRTFSTWIFWPHDPAVAKQLLKRVFAGPAPPPDVVLQIDPQSTLVAAEVERLGYRAHITRPEFGYAILLREPTPTPAPR